MAKKSTPRTVPTGAAGLHVELVDRLIDVAIDDDRFRALWIEADDRKALRRPFGPVTIHAVADEPDFPALVAAIEGILAGVGATVKNAAWSDTNRNARQLDATVELALDGHRVEGAIRFIVECSAFLAKRPRRAVAALVDKTNHLIHVMDFSA